MVRLLFVLAIVLPACSGSPGGPTITGKMNGPEAEKPASRVVTVDILHREPIASRTRVKHILIGWADKAEAYDGHIDARAAKRTQADAEAVVDDLLARLAGGAEFDDLMVTYSEDSGVATNPEGYVVKPDANLVLEFRTLGLRLEIGEVGVVESDFGFHIMRREE